MRLCLSALVVTTLACFQPTAFGNVLAYEGFDFAGPTINGQGSGFGFNGNWVNVTSPFINVTSDNTSLDSNAFPFTPIGNHIEGTGGQARRVMNNTFDLSQDGVVFYMSYLLKKSDSGAGANRNVEMILLSGTTTQVLRFGSTSSTAGPNADESRFFFGGTGGTQVSTLPVTYGETYFVVVKGVSSAASNDEFFAAVYDPTKTVPIDEPATWDLTYSFASVATSSILNQVRPTLGNSASGAFDEIRIGTSWADVTALPTLFVGDHNLDGHVDAADYVWWRKNDSGNQLGYDDWRANFGLPNSGAGTNVGAFSAVPEPSALALTAVAITATIGRRRRYWSASSLTEMIRQR